MRLWLLFNYCPPKGTEAQRPLAGLCAFLYIEAMSKTAEHIQKLLLKEKKTVSTAESITAGLLQSELASVSGSSKTFKGGITAYKLSVKAKLLNVDIDLAHDTDCVDEEVARQMAIGALKLFESDYAIATCGYAEKYEEQDIKSPFAFYAIADIKQNVIFSTRVELAGKRVEAQKQTAQLALKRFLELLNNN
ncbi:CinA family protein [Pontiellaceae bacterium B12227]|nr:CinA family protein [Pontiellaceae bacterium B12227]